MKSSLLQQVGPASGRLSDTWKRCHQFLFSLFLLPQCATHSLQPLAGWGIKAEDRKRNTESSHLTDTVLGDVTCFRPCRCLKQTLLRVFLRFFCCVYPTACAVMTSFSSVAPAASLLESQSTHTPLFLLQKCWNTFK